jgi:Competence protein CoiA-like family
MMYADTAAGRVEAAKGLQGTCPLCGEPVRPKCGSIVVHHWAHHARADCDPWAEPESEWHRGWKLAVPADRREVVIGPHRADVVTASGGVVELQHSAISPAVIEAREQFYGERMAWIFDTTEAARSGRLSGARTSGQTFRWMNPRKSVASCARQVLLDLGDGTVLAVDSFSPQAPAGGTGRRVTRESVRAWMASGSRWELCPVTPEPPPPPARLPARSGRLYEALDRFRVTRSPEDWAAYVALVRRAAGYRD